MEPITLSRTLEKADMLYESGEDMDRALSLSFRLTNAMNEMIGLGAADEQIDEIVHNYLYRDTPEMLLS